MLHAAFLEWLKAIAGLSIALATIHGVERFLSGRPEPASLSRRQAFNLLSMISWSLALYISWPFMFVMLRFTPPLANLSTGKGHVALSIACVVWLDLVQYGVHRALHVCGPLWRIHQLHHSDVMVDATTGVRHNLLEPIVGASVQGAFVVCVGMPASAILAYAILCHLQAMLSHAEIRFAVGGETFLRPILITPTLHRVHHICCPAGEAKNFGVLFPWWDRLFGTYSDMQFEEPEPRFGIYSEPNVAREAAAGAAV
jgi:sterol desaturase/sphingolipid hydroxylase (fatty acid hydroxylase superfamily)